MTGLKTKIQETLRSMSTTAHPMSPVYGVRDNVSKFTNGVDLIHSRGKSGPRRRKKWRSEHPLRELRLMKGLTLEELGDQTDLSPSYLSRLESGSRRLNADIIDKLCEVLACQPGELLATKPEVSYAGYEYSSVSKNTQTHDLPLYHLATKSDGAQTIDFAHPTEWMARPTELSEVTKAYAVALPNDAMSPRYYAGERLLAHPSKPLTNRCFVIVTTKEGNVAVGQFLGWRSAESRETALGPIQANENDKLVISCVGKGSRFFTEFEKEEDSVLIPRHIIGSIARVVGNLEAA